MAENKGISIPEDSGKVLEGNLDRPDQDEANIADLMTVRRITLPPDAPSGTVLERYTPNSLPTLMAGHHPIHGLFGAAFEKLGGFNRLVEWGNWNYSEFVKIFARMAPPPKAPEGPPDDGKREVLVNPALKPAIEGVAGSVAQGEKQA